MRRREPNRSTEKPIEIVKLKVWQTEKRTHPHRTRSLIVGWTMPEKVKNKKLRLKTKPVSFT